MKSETTLTLALILLTAGATGLIAAEGHNPENAAQDSDLVVHGVVSSISSSGEVAEHQPVKIDVIDAFKGNRTELLGKNLSNTITVQVKGTERMSVSTAAQFSEGEEVVVMLEEQEDRFYMTTGYATKYEVNNDTIQLVAPEQRNITLAEMENIVENTSVSSTNNTNPEMDEGSSSTESGFSITEPVKAVLEAVINWVL
jgi:hypothetical protein